MQFSDLPHVPPNNNCIDLIYMYSVFSTENQTITNDYYNNVNYQNSENEAQGKVGSTTSDKIVLVFFKLIG